MSSLQTQAHQKSKVETNHMPRRSAHSCFILTQSHQNCRQSPSLTFCEHVHICKWNVEHAELFNALIVQLNTWMPILLKRYFYASEVVCTCAILSCPARLDKSAFIFTFFFIAWALLIHIYCIMSLGSSVTHLCLWLGELSVPSLNFSIPCSGTVSINGRVSHAHVPLPL